MTVTRALVRCDGATPSAELARESWTVQKSISWRGPSANLNLRAQSLAGTVLTKVEDRAADLVRIASYVYAADREISRGGSADVYGKQWRRHIAMCLPVTDPGFWAQESIRARLATTLSFLTDDTWEFEFSPGSPENRQLPLDLREHVVLSNPDSVILFSGGADSLCTTVEAVSARGEKPVLVSHRSSLMVDSRQKALVAHLRHRLGASDFPHLSFWVHRKGSDAVDTSQRSRGFLFASLGAAVAGELSISRVLLGDNGVVSLNLPISGQLVGALASRSTHPKFIRLFNDLVTEVLQSRVRVSNPLNARTRPEVLAILPPANAQELLQKTTSCSRVRGQPSAKPHCGFCFQCVDRRFGSIAAGLEEHDLEERYGLDIFCEALREGEARTTAESYLRFARGIAELSDEQILIEYPQLHDCILPDDPAPHETACQLVGMLKRHAESVIAVVAEMVARRKHELAAGSLPQDCLLRLATAGPPPEPAEIPTEDNAFRREGHYWTVVFRGTTRRFKNAKGLAYIARLLRTPGREFHVMDLVQFEVGQPTSAGSDPYSEMSSEQLATEGLSISGQSTKGTGLDAQAKAEYQHHLEDLREELREAEQFNDLERAAKVQEEIEFIEQELAAAYGLGGKPRKRGDLNERARQAVSAAIHRSLRTIETALPELGRHLRNVLKIGLFCSYVPDPPTTWVT